MQGFKLNTLGLLSIFIFPLSIQAQDRFNFNKNGEAVVGNTPVHGYGEYKNNKSFIKGDDFKNTKITKQSRRAVDRKVEEYRKQKEAEKARREEKRQVADKGIEFTQDEIKNLNSKKPLTPETREKLKRLLSQLNSRNSPKCIENVSCTHKNIKYVPARDKDKLRAIGGTFGGIGENFYDIGNYGVDYDGSGKSPELEFETNSNHNTGVLIE